MSTGLIRSPEAGAKTDENALEMLLGRIRLCTLCAAHLPCTPRPVLRPKATARLLIVGQAPGRKVHETGVPWNDPSGDRLRHWLDMTREEFYGNPYVAIVPAGFCYPGRGRGGDLPPRPECAPLWHPLLRAAMPEIRLVLLVGAYAQTYYMGSSAKGTLGETVHAWREYLPMYFPLPHPSPRNNRWLRMRPWFNEEVLPNLKEAVRKVLSPT